MWLFSGNVAADLVVSLLQKALMAGDLVIWICLPPLVAGGLCVCGPNGEMLLSPISTQGHVPLWSCHCSGVNLWWSPIEGRERGFYEIDIKTECPTSLFPFSLYSSAQVLLSLTAQTSPLCSLYSCFIPSSSDIAHSPF